MAVPTAATTCRAGWTQMCLEGTVVYGSGGPWRSREVHEGAGFDARAATGCALLRDGGGHLLRHRHGLGRAQAAPPAGRRDNRHLRPGPGGPVGDATRGGHGRACHRRRHRGRAPQFGAHEVLDPAVGDVVAAIRDLTHGEGAHKTLDASSAPDARAAAVRAVRSWGTACFVGERGQVTLDVSPDLLRRQVTLVGSWTFSKQGQAECAEFVADRRVDVERLFTHRWKLEQAEEAYRLFDTQTTGKAVILPS
jgi:Zinc-binding dehydrogenase